MDEVIFETYGFSRALVASSPLMAAFDPLCAAPPGSAAARARAALVLDCGFSATHAVPVFDGRVVRSGVRRINLGGKALTNYLKEVVSFRSMNMMDEFVLMDRIKELTCYVAADVRFELAAARRPRASNPVALEYVLPDGVDVLRGYVRDSGPASQLQGEGGLQRDGPGGDGAAAGGVRGAELGAGQGEGVGMTAMAPRAQAPLPAGQQTLSLCNEV